MHRSLHFGKDAALDLALSSLEDHADDLEGQRVGERDRNIGAIAFVRQSDLAFLPLLVQEIHGSLDRVSLWSGALNACGSHCKTAIVMVLANLNADEAKTLLANNNGFIRKALQK